MSKQVDFIGHIGKVRYALVEDGKAWLEEASPLFGHDQYIGRNMYTLTTDEVDKLYAAMHADEEDQS